MATHDPGPPAASPDTAPAQPAPIFFDGGAALNPGTIVIAVVHGSYKFLQRLDEVRGGNNEAEFRAAMAALDYAATASLHGSVIAGDSDAVISSLAGGCPPKAGKLTELYQACSSTASRLDGITWERVPRTNPAGQLIQAERRLEKAIRRAARRDAGLIE